MNGRALNSECTRVVFRTSDDDQADVRSLLFPTALLDFNGIIATMPARLDATQYRANDHAHNFAELLKHFKADELRQAKVKDRGSVTHQLICLWHWSSSPAHHTELIARAESAISPNVKVIANTFYMYAATMREDVRLPHDIELSTFDKVPANLCKCSRTVLEAALVNIRREDRGRRSKRDWIAHCFQQAMDALPQIQSINGLSLRANGRIMYTFTDTSEPPQQHILEREDLWVNEGNREMMASALQAHKQRVRYLIPLPDQPDDMLVVYRDAMHETHFYPTAKLRLLNWLDLVPWYTMIPPPVAVAAADAAAIVDYRESSMLLHNLPPGLMKRTAAFVRQELDAMNAAAAAR